MAPKNADPAKYAAHNIGACAERSNSAFVSGFARGAPFFAYSEQSNQPRCCHHQFRSIEFDTFATRSAFTMIVSCDAMVALGRSSSSACFSSYPKKISTEFSPSVMAVRFHRHVMSREEIGRLNVPWRELTAK